LASTSNSLGRSDLLLGVAQNILQVGDLALAGPIKVKRIYEAPAKADGLRVLVDRMWPRGMTKEAAAIDTWMRDIAPSPELRKWFGHDPEKWEQFCARYARELEAKADDVARLKAQSRTHVVTLLYGAKDTVHNNAVALKRYLETR
jgi:uncharacterized protein YeaO (DUF488 family)